MNLSGILVIVPPETIGEGIARLQALPGVEVYHHDPENGRIVVVQEAKTIEDEVKGLKHIKSLPQVILAEMVYHYFAEDGQLVTKIPQELDDMEGLQHGVVPDYLNDV